MTATETFAKSSYYPIPLMILVILLHIEMFDRYKLISNTTLIEEITDITLHHHSMGGLSQFLALSDRL